MPRTTPCSKSITAASACRYLRKAKEIHAASNSAEGFAEALKGAYPSHYGGGWVDFSSLLLYGIINP
jgi:hypothetical protein